MGGKSSFLSQGVGACSLPRTCWEELLFEGLFEASTFPPVEKEMGESEEEEKGGIGLFLLKEFQGFNLKKKKQGIKTQKKGGLIKALP